MRSLTGVAVLSLLPLAYCNDFITSIKHVDPEQDLATIPNRPMITVIVKSQVSHERRFVLPYLANSTDLLDSYVEEMTVLSLIDYRHLLWRFLSSGQNHKRL